jgi:iron(III) transport system permease protein
MSALKLNRRWFYLSLGCCVLAVLPLLSIYFSFSQFSLALWQHLTTTTLGLYISNSMILAVGVALCSATFGVSTAWLVTQYRFPGVSWLQWAMLLPMAMPAYIIAYTYTGMLDVASPLQFWIRQTFNLTGSVLPEIRSLPGAILMLSLVLFPYVFLLAKTAFNDQRQNLRDVSASLGVTGAAFFVKVALPIARPAIFTGVALVVMETLADYGTVQYFGVSTFTTGIFRTWFGMGEMALASQLSAILATCVLLLLFWERYLRRNMAFYQTTQSRRIEPRNLSFVHRWLCALYCIGLLSIAFVIPVSQLAVWAWQSVSSDVLDGYSSLLFTTIGLALLASVLTVSVAILLSYAQRITGQARVVTMNQIAGIGYAIPGTVIAVGVLVPFGWLDQQLNQLSFAWFNHYVGLIFSGTLFVLIFAYVVRFLSVAMHNTQSGLERIKPNMDDAALSLGKSRFAVFTHVHVPLLRGALFSALLLVFVDVLKELPATLILRPFNVNTLAVKAFEYASDERLMDAALPSITIVLVGIVPVILLTRAMRMRS